MSQNDEWDLQITSNPSFFEFDFKEFWRYKDLLWLFVRRDFVSQYKQTILGPIWHLVQPILTTMMFMLVFGKIAKISTDGVNPILFYMAGIAIWNYFSFSLTSTSSTFLTNSNIFGKVYFPRLIMPVSVILSNIVRFGIQILLLVCTIFWLYASGQKTSYINWHWLFIPFLVLFMAGLSFGLGIIISSLTTKYRDFTVLLSFAVQLLMYATPVVYPMSYLQNSKYAWLIKLNPLTSIFETFRYCLFGSGTFNLNDLIYSVSFMLLTILAGLFLFNRVEKTFMDTV